jgi:hypothetical protein
VLPERFGLKYRTAEKVVKKEEKEEETEKKEGEEKVVKEVEK